MKHVIFPTFPCVICGKRYNTEEEYLAECDRIEKANPKLVEAIRKSVREDYEIEREIFREKIAELHKNRLRYDKVQRTQDND